MQNLLYPRARAIKSILNVKKRQAPLRLVPDKNLQPPRTTVSKESLCNCAYHLIELLTMLNYNRGNRSKCAGGLTLRPLRIWTSSPKENKSRPCLSLVVIWSPGTDDDYVLPHAWCNNTFICSFWIGMITCATGGKIDWACAKTARVFSGFGWFQKHKQHEQSLRKTI
jgi:hypothetical protein